MTTSWSDIGRCVYDDNSSKRVAYDDAASKRIAYCDTLSTTASVTFSRNGTGDTVADAVDNMKTAGWASMYPLVQLQAYTLHIMGYDVRQTAARISLPAGRSVHIRKVTFTIDSVFGSPTWRVGWRAGEESGAPVGDWSWTDDAPSVTGTSTGDQELTIDEDCTYYLWLIGTLYPYTSTVWNGPSFSSNVNPVKIYL